MLTLFKEFVQDIKAWDFYITGRAGTGKTTDLSYLVDYCHAQGIDCTVCAYTHKACTVLASKLMPGTDIITLHKFLNKRPTINGNAKSKKHISSNCQVGSAKETTILFIDEYSMIGERDLMDLRAAQDTIGTKLVFLGDPYQLPPVGDTQAVKPYGKYCIILTEIKRQAKDNPLGKALEQLVGFIEGKPVVPLIESTHLVRGRDLVKEQGDITLAYTNERVQELNAKVQGKALPTPGDTLFSPTTRNEYKFIQWTAKPTHIELPFGDLLTLGTKYKTLEYLIKNKTKFAILEDLEGNITTMAVVFGHYDYKLTLDDLKLTAAESNRVIEHSNAAAWSRENKLHPLARKRATAWRDFLSFNECVVCIDFNHAMTVHKSQGSTYGTVLVDTEDLYKAAHFSMQTYLKLLYVALSRASEKVITN